MSDYKAYKKTDFENDSILYNTHQLNFDVFLPHV